MNNHMKNNLTFFLKYTINITIISLFGIWLDNLCIFFQNYHKKIQEAAPLLFSYYYSLICNEQAFPGIYPHCYIFLTIVNVIIITLILKKFDPIHISKLLQAARGVIQKYTLIVTLLHSFLIAQVFHFEILYTADDVTGFPLIARKLCASSFFIVLIVVFGSHLLSFKKTKVQKKESTEDNHHPDLF